MPVRQLFALLFLVAAPLLAFADSAPDTDGTIPEPATLALLGAGAAGLIFSKARKRK